MKKYVPNKMEQASREDILKAIQTEIQQGLGCGERKDCVLLDVTHFGEKRILENFPRTRELVLKLLDIDLMTDKVPVAPVADYSIGGLLTSPKGQVMDSEGNPVAGLYAAGECSCVSIHGSSGLTGNRILEKVIFGKKCARTMLSIIPSQKIYPVAEEHLLKVQNRLDIMLRRDGNEKQSAIRKELQKLMTEKAGIFRNGKDLLEAKDMIMQLKSRFERIGLSDRSKHYNTELVQAFETSNLLEAAIALVESAVARKETRGVNNRTDFRKADNAAFLKHTLISRQGQAFSIKFKEPTITLLKPKNES